MSHFYVKFLNIKSMTKKRSSAEILADENDIFLGQIHTEKCNLRNFSSQSQQFSEIGGNALLSQGGWTPLAVLIVAFNSH